MNKNSTKLTIIILLLVTGTLHTVSAQVYQKFGKDAFNIDTSAALEINSDTKGFLPPRMTTKQRDDINNADGSSKPANGLVIYNTSTNRLEINTGSTGAEPKWKELTIPPSYALIKKDNATIITDTVLCDTSAFINGLTLRLPTATRGQVITIGKIDDTGNELKFSSNLILPGGATVSTLNYAKVFRIQGDGDDWHVLE